MIEPDVEERAAWVRPEVVGRTIVDVRGLTADEIDKFSLEADAKDAVVYELDSGVLLIPMDSYGFNTGFIRVEEPEED